MRAAPLRWTSIRAIRDPTTVPEQVTKLHESFGPERVIVVSGHGLLTQTQMDTLKQ